MNFDLFYTSKKPVRLSKKEREKVLELVFRFSQDVDKKIEYFLYHNWDNFFGKFQNRIELAYVKNKILYIEVDSSVVYQEVLFLLPQINQKLYLTTGENIKSIKMISYQKLKKQKDEHTAIKKNSYAPEKKETINQKLIEDIKKMLGER
jgi:hypothetical protein